MCLLKYPYIQFYTILFHVVLKPHVKSSYLQYNESLFYITDTKRRRKQVNRGVFLPVSVTRQTDIKC